MPSKQTIESGILYLVPTPLGNLNDLTQRAVEILGTVDQILAEDTRHSGQLLNSLNIHKPMTSFHDHNETQRIELVEGLLDDGKNLALVSDAGTPTISDPGYHLVAALREDGYKVCALPGPCAAVTALSASGLPSDCFTFIGFLPQNGSARKESLERALKRHETFILYESPHRIHTLIGELRAAGHRPLCVARELTKIHEEIIRSYCDTITEEEVRPQGEFTVIVGPAPQEENAAGGPDDEKLADLLKLALEQGLSKKSAAELASRFLKISKKTAYQAAIDLAGGE